MEKLKKEFKKMMAHAGKADEDKALEEFCKKYESDEKALVQIRQMIKDGITESGKRIEDLTVKMQMKEASEMLNLSFIAKNYFHKTKSWLSQRINSHTVNGKPAKFTDEEMDILNFALKDMGKKIGSISIQC